MFDTFDTDSLIFPWLYSTYIKITFISVPTCTHTLS